MDLNGKKILLKLKAKNKGNNLLVSAIDELIVTIESTQWKSKEDVKANRSDADQVHADGFFFFDINIHRTMVLLLFGDNEAEVVWAGTHQEYENTFKNNKNVIKKWLSDRDWI